MARSPRGREAAQAGVSQVGPGEYHAHGTFERVLHLFDHFPGASGTPEICRELRQFVREVD